VWVIGRWKWSEPAAWFGFRKTMKEKDFDAVYDIQRNDRTRVFYHLSPPRLKNSWLGGARASEIYVHTKPLPAGMLDTTQDEIFPIPDLSWMEADISRFNVSQPFVLFVPGSAPQHPGKRWPVAHYATLAQKLKGDGYTVVAIGSGAEADLIQELAALAPGIVNLCGKTSFMDIAALARKAAAAIGNDTGPMHLIAVVGCPVITLFSGLSDPQQSAPRGKSVTTLRGIPIETLEVEKVWGAFLKIAPPVNGRQNAAARTAV
jgi:ADP-heptose:LPS heptosyltransferase